LKLKVFRFIFFRSLLKFINCVNNTILFDTGQVMNILKLSILVCVSLNLTACTTPTYLSKFDNATSSLSNSDGVIYFLPRQLHMVELTRNQSCVTALKMTASALVPDTKFKFIIQPNVNHFRDDTLNLKTTPTGLLSSTASISDGKLDDIIVDIAGAVATAGITGPASGPAVTCKPVKSVGIYDLSKKNVRASLIAEAKVLDFDIRFENGLDMIDTTVLDNELKTSLEAKKGIFYRRPVSYTAAVSCTGTSNCNPEIINLNLPQGGPIGYIIPNGSSLSEESDTLTFQNGLLTDWNTVRKSPVAEVAKLPIEIAKEIITVPNSLLTLRTENINALSSLEQARAGIESATTTNTSNSIKNEGAILIEELKLKILRLCVSEADDSADLNECLKAGS